MIAMFLIATAVVYEVKVWHLKDCRVNYSQRLS